MVRKRQINGGKELIDFFCSVAHTDVPKEYCKYFVYFVENYCICKWVYTSYKDGDMLYKDLCNPNIKWNITFDCSFRAYSEILRFENENNHIEFEVIDYDYDKIKNFFEANK